MIARQDFAILDSFQASTADGGATATATKPKTATTRRATKRTAPARKRVALQALAQNTRNRILATLGPAAGPEYVKVADSWLNNVERGSAVSFTRGTTMAIITDQGTMSYSGGAEYRRLPPVPQPGR